MSYVVLARKYRPQNFDEVYAQEQVTTILKNALTLNRIAHAYLFTGSRGVGKTSMARIFAKSLNCMEGMSSHPCNVCENCVEITQGISNDVVEIDGASNTGVDDIRDLQKELMYATTKSRYKVFIIDEVHMLSKNAFNALLKTLEEPPERVVFIFATTEPHKVLPTIISRCQRYDFKRIPIDAIVSRLKSICEEEEITIEEEGFYNIAKKADGSMRDALSLLDQLMAVGGKSITTNEVLMIFGMVSTEVYHKITECLQQKKTGGMIALLHNTLEKGNDLQEFINGYLDYIRILLLLKTGVPQPEIPTSLREEMAEINKSFTEDSLLYILSVLIKARTDIRQSANPLLIMEMTLIKLTKLEEMVSVLELLEKTPIQESQTPIPAQTERKSLLESYEAKKTYTHKREEKEQVKETSVSPQAPVAKTKIPAQTEQKKITVELYEQTKKEALAKLPMITNNYFKELTLKNITDNKLFFEVNQGSAFSYLEDKKSEIGEVLAKYYKRPVSIDLTLRIQEKKEEDYIKNPTLKDIQQELPELAKFIEGAEASITQLPLQKKTKK
ncbi:MAG: DNA polymerase III subunit gamma/tau [Candidatus Cloacimonas sp.]|nr:DNA polymerase III subunit gamma/tau [Candidatus Cloacimonadota bacterium]